MAEFNEDMMNLRHDIEELQKAITISLERDALMLDKIGKALDNADTQKRQINVVRLGCILNSLAIAMMILYYGLVK